MAAKIKSIHGREIIDSRGWPTVEADIVLDNSQLFRAAVPSGASTGTFEAVELRDGDATRFLGKGVMQAVSHVSGAIQEKLKGFGTGEQEKLDSLLMELDGTPNKAKLGANAILAVSMAYAKASAATEGLELFQYFAKLNGEEGNVLPVPLMNVINGGKHADNEIDIQEFMIVPCAATFKDSLRMGTEVFQNLKKILHAKKLSTALGDEGGFAPEIGSNREVLDLLCEASRKSGYEPGRDLFIALDVAATELFENGHYKLKTEEGVKKSAEELVTYYTKLSTDYPIISIEDGLSEEDWAGWKKLTDAIGGRVQLVGDDLFVTNPARLKKGIDSKTANSILIKVNQIGSLTETFKAIQMAKKSGYRNVISHRSGETEDVTIADIAVGTCAGQIKTGSLSRSERLAKYNQLLRIEEQLGVRAKFPGKSFYSR